MNFKTTYLLFGLLGLMLVLFAASLWMGPTKSTDTLYVLPSAHEGSEPVPVKDVTTIEIERSRPKEEKLVFQRDGERWRMAEPINARVDQLAVNQIVNQILDARKNEKRDVPPTLDQAGLDSPAAVVTVKTEDKEWKINLGADTGKDPSAVVYVTSSDLPKSPMAVRRSELASVLKNVNEYRAKDLLAESAFDIQSVTAQDAKGEKVALEKKGEGNRWKFAQPPFGEADYEGEALSPGRQAKPASGVRSVLDALAAIKVEGEADFVADNVTDLAKYGLEEGKPATLRLEIKRNLSGFGSDKKFVTETLLIGNKADEKGEKLYARLADEKHVVKVGAKNVEPVQNLLKDPTAYRDRDLVHIDTNRTDFVEIKNDAGPIKLWKVGEFGDRWNMKAGDAKTRQADRQAMQDLLKVLAEKRQVEKFPKADSKDADLGFDKPTSVLSLWEDGVKKDEKKDDEKKDGDKKDEKKDEKKDDTPPKLKSDKPTVKLTFGKRDTDDKGAFVYVKRETAEGETALVAVREAVLPKVKEGPLAYLDKDEAITPLDRNAEVTKIVIVRGGETYEVEKEKDKDKKDDKGTWKLKQPKDLAGRTANASAVEQLLATLWFLHPEKLIAEKVSDGDLDKYGLKSPQVKLTVTIQKDNKPQDFVYLFGKELEDKNNPAIYAKQGERDIVFTVRKDVVESTSRDLADPSVFSFDPSKVTAVKLAGWQDVVGRVDTIEVEKKDGAWKVKSPPNFTVEATKIDGLLKALSPLRAEKFVVYKAGPKPEHKLDAKDGALEIALTLEGEKEPLTLTVGAPDTEGKSYYAKSGKLPGDVFLVPKSGFERMKSKPAYFSSKD